MDEKEKKRPLLYFLGAFLLSAALFFGWLMAKFYALFELNLSWGATDTGKEDSLNVFLFSLIYVVPLAVLAFFRYKKRNTYSALGFGIPAVIVFLFYLVSYLLEI